MKFFLNIQNQRIRAYFFTLIVLSFIIRAFLSFWLELGNDEVYYTLFARFPDWSHFDHPPMLGRLMQLTSLNLRLDQEFFIRLSSVVLFTINTFLMFDLGLMLRNEQTGLIAALLYNASVYSFIITGIFILPDTPQNFFWLISLWLVVRMLNLEKSGKKASGLLLLVGLALGLGMLSKYTSLFFWFGLTMFFLFHDRKWLKRKSLFIAMLISLVCLTPLFYWNYLNDFVSFGFHTGRISLRDGGLRFDFFLTELLGEIMYSNPVNYLLIVVATISLLNQKSPLKVVESRLFLWLGLPMIVTFLFFSLFRSTLPHWTGPAFQTLLLPAAAWLDQTTIQNSHKRLVPKIVIVSLVVQSLLLLAGSLQIKVGILPFKTSQDIHKLGEDDFSLDMYGWDEVKDPFERIREQAIRKGMMAENSRIIGENWFPLSHFDFYIARPLGMQVYGWGNLDRIHKYHWINKIQRETVTGESFWYLTTSRDFKDPNLFYGNDFREINLVDTIPIQRNSKVVKQIFVYTLVGLKMEAVNPADQP